MRVCFFVRACVCHKAEPVRQLSSGVTIHRGCFQVLSVRALLLKSSKYQTASFHPFPSTSTLAQLWWFTEHAEDGTLEDLPQKN